MKFTDDAIDTTKIVASIACVYLSFMIQFESKSPQGDMNYISAVGASAVPIMVALIAGWIARLRKSVYSKAIFICTMIVVATASIAGMQGYSLSSSPKNYEQCMLDSMKGQDRSMYSIASRECRRLHPQ